MLTLGFVADRIGHATRAQIVAALPPSLRTQDHSDPAGEKRYARLLALTTKLRLPDIERGLGNAATPATRAKAAQSAKPILAQLSRALDGTLRIPEGVAAVDEFPNMAGFKELSKTIALATDEAARRKDRRACGEYATLNIRLSQALFAAGGDAISLTVATGFEAISDRAAFEADVAGGLDAETRKRVLKLLPPLNGPTPVLASTLRREFYEERMPLLLDPIRGAERQMGSLTDLAPKPRGAERPPGNYDPIATARLIGRTYEAAMADALRPWNAQTGLAGRLAQAEGKGVPQPAEMSTAAYSERMDAIPNSLGRMLASVPPFDGLALVGARRATYRNLVRAALLLRAGEKAALPDPFGKGPLKTDPKRRIVWSVGENGRDDSGSVGKGRGGKALDLGYRY